MKKYERNSEITRNNIIDSFWQLYKNNDLSKITVTDICKNANYDRTTFYRYFFDISDILNHIEDFVIDNIKNSLDDADNIQNVPFSSFKSFNNKYGEYIVIFSEKANRHFYLKYKELIKNDVFKYLKLDIQSERKKEFLFEFIFSSLISSYVYWYRNQEMIDIEEFAKMINNMVLHTSHVIINDLK